MEVHDKIKRCTACYNSKKYRPKCEYCHYTGWMTLDDEPASVIFGENDKWKKKMKRIKK